MMLERRRYTLWTTLRPAEDVPGEWVAHVLDLDVVTQGRSVAHAIHMAQEAAQLVIVEDLNEERDPLHRGTDTPPDCWEELWSIRERGRQVGSLKELEATMARRSGLCIVQIMVGVECHVPDVEHAPLAWLDPERNSVPAMPCA